ncbi:protein lin-28 homolog isoform X3 [Lineus longissimus]|uniref:protein lin-28 homolog isoform X3 n=1 Tax=Lineus longissimus TaxID=88925 RepID=UPI002B4CB2E7
MRLNQQVEMMEEEGGPGGRRRGKCKWFNVVKKYGFITPEDNGQDVFVHQSVIQRAGFRSLADGEEVEFECRISDKGIEATHVSGPGGLDCKGRPPRQRKFKCYNCGEYSNHLAAKCPKGPLPKSCYQCHGSDHLIKDCPKREQKITGKDKGNGDGSDPHSSSSGNAGRSNGEQGT